MLQFHLRGVVYRVIFRVESFVILIISESPYKSQTACNLQHHRERGAFNCNNYIQNAFCIKTRSRYLLPMAASSLIDFLIHTHGVVRAKYCGRAASERAMIYEQRETQKVSPHTVHNFNQVQRAHSLARSWLLFVRFLHRSVRKLDAAVHRARALCNHVQHSQHKEMQSH